MRAPHSRRSPAGRRAGWLAVAALLLLSGCGVTQSLKFDNLVMVKVPGNRTTPLAQAGGWSFRHVVKGPSSPKMPPGDWYVAWRDDVSRQPHFSLPGSAWRY